MQLIKLAIFSLIIFIFSACASDPMLSQDIKLTKEQEELILSKTLKKEPLFYTANIKTFKYPTNQQLMQEIDIKDQEVYAHNSKILTNWILNKYSTKQKKQFIKNCNLLVGKYQKKFPLAENTLACAAWWITRNNYFNSLKNIINTPALRSSIPRYAIKSWLSFKKLNLKEALALIDVNLNNEKEFKNYTSQVIQSTQDCNFINANVAFILKLENYLPDKDIYMLIEKIYRKMDRCLIPNTEVSEKIHLRMGLLRLIMGNIKLAHQALLKTQLESEPKENSRSLFWLGFLLNQQNPNKSNIYWQKLTTEMPLSFSSLVANKKMGIDPMSLLIDDEKIPLNNRISGGWTSVNLSSFIFELLLANKEINAANIWANYVTKNNNIDEKLLLYWALSQNKLKNYGSSIRLLANYFSNYKKNAISPGLLNLQFPQPYLDNILNIHSTVDPIFILSLIRQESVFDTYAHSNANARGLMQVLPKTAKLINPAIKAEQLYNPDINLAVGTKLLENLFKQYNGKAEYVLAAYNAGSKNLEKWLLRVPTDNIMLFSDYIPFQETRSYISLILRNNYWYSKIVDTQKNKTQQKLLINTSSILNQYGLGSVIPHKD